MDVPRRRYIGDVVEVKPGQFYRAYNLFRVVAITQGIVGRMRDGTVVSANARDLARAVRPLAEYAWHEAKLAGAES